MGIRANSLADYSVPDYCDQTAVASLLASALPATQAVADYWRATDPDYVATADTWIAELAHNPPENNFLRYHGPGGFSVAFGQHVVRVHAACRWSGFATISPLQRVHAGAFRSIGRALGSSRIVLIPDFDPVEEMALYAGSSLDECIALLRERWGVPHPTTDIVTDDGEVYYKRKLPVWYVENIKHDS